MTQPSMHIGVDARSLLCREPRGEGKSLLRLYREMLELAPTMRATFFGDEAAAGFAGELPPRCRVVARSVPGHRWGLWERAYLPAAALASGCDVLHCASSTGPGWKPLPTLLTVHDLIPLRFDDGHTPEQRRAFRHGLQAASRGACAIIAVSSSTQSDLVSEWPELTPIVHVVHWGGDAMNRVPTLPRRPPYLVCFGGEAPRKNLAYTLERFFAVARACPDLNLVVLGMGREAQRRRVLEIAMDAGMQDRIELPGFVDEAALGRWLDGACALLYLSLYEGFGLPVLEAIGRGVAVLASNCTSIPEILAGVPGCIDLADTAGVESAMLGLATDPDLRRRWRDAQSSVLPRFTWRRTAECTLRILRQAVQGRPVLLEAP